MSRPPKTPLAIRAKRVLARLERVRGLSDDEKALHALGIAATPEERWELMDLHRHLFGRAKVTSESAYSIAGRLGRLV